MQLLNKVNKYSSAVDVTANMVIGGPLRNYFMSVFNVYVNEATEYVKQHPDYRAQEQTKNSRIYLPISLLRRKKDNI